MKKIVMLFVCILMFSNIAFSSEIDDFYDKMCVVDLQKIVNASGEVQTLKKEREKKLSELNNTVLKAQTEISKETDVAKMVAIQEKYTKEFNQKKSEIDKIYSQKLTNIENKIKTDISKIANKQNYKIVFAKSVVLYGGKDITNEILKSVK